MSAKMPGRRYRHHARRVHILCPHCRAPGAVRTSREASDDIRQLYVHCTNESCGHQWLAQMHNVHTIVPPAQPRPGVMLKLGPTMAQMMRDEKPPDDPPEPVPRTG